jgi:alkylhydroperoxidase family enzyme
VALTLVSESHAPDDVSEEMRTHFSSEEQVLLTSAIVAINGWNRIAIGFRAVPGRHQPAAARGAA